MAVVIRLRRAGSKKRPFYHMVVADSRKRRDGRFIEKVGYYNPLPRQEEISFDEERIAAWIAKGAKPSTTVDRLIKRKQKGVTGPSTKERKRALAKGAAAAEAVVEAAAKASAEQASEPAKEAKPAAEAAPAETAPAEAEAPAEEETATTDEAQDDGATADAGEAPAEEAATEEAATEDAEAAKTTEDA